MHAGPGHTVNGERERERERERESNDILQYSKTKMAEKNKQINSVII
jgi:hypothetical protein